MRLIVVNKKAMNVIPYDLVTGISYNANTDILTITYGNNQTASYVYSNYVFMLD